MDSFSDRVGSSMSSTLRRYTPVQSRVQCWPKGMMISDGQAHLECQVPRELAYQAQIAACNYLGYSPREFSTSQFRQQTISADPSRPVELHMHHHHHHYLASPTSPFSQTNSAPFFGEPELAGTAADLKIRVGSPGLPTHTTSGNNCPMLDPLESPIKPSHISNFVQNSSQGPLRSHGHYESNQRPQNVLWLKNQSAEDEVNRTSYRCGQEARGESTVSKAGGLIKKDSASQLSSTSDIRSIEYPNQLSWSKGYDSEQQQRAEKEVNGCCRQTFAPLRKSDVNSIRVAKKQKDAEGRSYQSPYGSLSDETSATEESVTPTIYEARPISQRAFQSMVDPRKAKCIHGTKEVEELAGNPYTLDRRGSQAAERPLATGKLCIRSSSQPHSNGVYDEASGSSRYDDETTSAGKDSFSGSENVSGHLCNWACVGPPKGQKREYGPQTKAPRKNFGSRASRRQASREARGWECKERRTFQGLCHSEVREDETTKHPSTHALESPVEVGEKADVSRCPYEQGKLSPGNGNKGILDWRDAAKFEVQKVEKQSCLPCLHLEVTKSRKHAEHVKVLDSASLEGNDIVEDILDGDERRGTEKLKSEYLQDPVWSASYYSPWTNDPQNNKSTSHNRFREAVEAAWKTSLGTKGEPESDDLNCRIIGDVGGASQESPQAKLNSHIVTRVAPSPLDDTARVAEECVRDLFDERSLSQAKFKEELEQGVTDRLRLQELLQLEKFKLEATERELREVKKSFQEALLPGTKVNKKHASEPRLEHQPLNMHMTSGVAEGRGDSKLKQKFESEARLAAEAKASYFEASNKAAEEKIQSLLKERNWFYSRFKVELENNNTDKTASKLSMEQDNITVQRYESPQRKKSDARALVASSVADKPSHGLEKDEKRVAQNGTHEKASYHNSVNQELEQQDADRHKLQRLLELEESRRESIEGREGRTSMVLPLVVSPKQETPPVFATEKGLQREFQRNCSPSFAVNPDTAKQLEAVGDEASNPKIGEQRLCSPTSSSRTPKCEPNLPFSVKIERCRLKDGKTTTTFDISPNFGPKGNSRNKNGCKLELTNNEDTESTNCSDNSSNFVVKIGDDEELISSKIRSYTYNISDKQDKNLDAEGEEHEETKSGEFTGESDGNSVDRRDRFYQQSESDRSKKQSDLSAAESIGTSICSEESNAYRHNESDIPKGHRNARIQRTPDAEVHENYCDAKGKQSPDRHGKHVERDEGDLVTKKGEGFDNSLMLLPSKWKRATKAELRKIIEEQELTWKIAEDAVDELGRRLEMLERYKMDLQDNLSSCRVGNDREQFWTRLEKRFEGSPRGFSSVYHSPVFEDRLGSVERETSGETARHADTPGAVAHVSHQSNDIEIQKLKADIAGLKRQLCGRRSSRATSPTKEDFRYSSSSSSPPTPPLPPPPATPATPPTPPTVQDYQHHPFQEFSNGGQVPLVIGFGHVRDSPEVAVDVLEAEKIEAQAENVKDVTSQATENGRNGYFRRTADRDHFHEGLLSDVSHLENRSWVPMPDDESVEGNWVVNNLSENGGRNPSATGQNFAFMKSSRLLHPTQRCSGNDDTMSCKLNLDEGEVEVPREAVLKISKVFQEQEGNLKRFKGAVNMAEADPSQYLEMRNFYISLLRKMSEQLGELCRDLQTDSCESVNNPETMLRPLVGSSEVDQLRIVLEAVERQIEEEVNINCLLKDKVDAGDKHLSMIVKEHAEELLSKEKTVSFAQQLNLQLANEMSITESSLAELRARYKGLVANLESQLEEAREEVINLHCTLSDLKLEVERNQNLVIDLERAGQEKKLQIQEFTERIQAYQSQTEGNESLVKYLERAGQEKDLQIQGLTERMQAYQSETHQMSEEKFELLKNIQELRREADNQQSHILELVNINEELIEFAQSKEDEVKALTKEVTSLQQVSKGKSDEANKLAVEAANSLRELIEAKTDGESYRLRCRNLKSKLEDTEEELMAREDALERLTGHLGSAIEGQDLISQEKEQLLLSLSKAQYKERRMDDQIRQSKVIIQDLEDKVSCMEEELTKARIVMTELKVKGIETSAIEKEAGEMRCRVHQLEEEIMEKEGQISILKSSYPGEFESTF